MQGSLHFHKNEWYFHPGTSKRNKPILLRNFYNTAHKLIDNLQLFQGHPHFKTIKTMQLSNNIGAALARHISAKKLTSSDVPSLLNHHSLTQTDRVIWDAAYKEEYDGLTHLPAWVTITEAE